MCLRERTPLGLLPLLCFASWAAPAATRSGAAVPSNTPLELRAQPQPEFPPRLRDLLMLAGSPGGGKSHYYLGRPRPPRASAPPRPAPPPPQIVNGAPAPLHPVTGTRRHKERSKQGARCSLPGPFIKLRPRGKRRQPPTRPRAGSSRTL